MVNCLRSCRDTLCVKLLNSKSEAIVVAHTPFNYFGQVVVIFVSCMRRIIPAMTWEMCIIL